MHDDDVYRSKKHKRRNRMARRLYLATAVLLALEIAALAISNLA